MTLDDIPVPTPITLSQAARHIEDAVQAQNLRVTLRQPLVTASPGSLHWHLKKGTEPGTLEVSLLNRERVVVLSVRTGRSGTWTTVALEALSTALLVRLGG